MDLAILGATGAVGRQLLYLIEKRNLPIHNISLYASKNSHGKKILFKEQEIRIKNIDSILDEKFDLAFSCLSSTISKKLLPNLENIQTIIDLSSAFRMNPNIPLIIPEINAYLLKNKSRLIASPNCVASILVMALAPLSKIGKLKRVILSTYQAASGGGQKLLQDLLDHTKEYFEKPKNKSPYAFNLYLHPSRLNENFYSDEEQKVIEETRKILDLSDLPISVTCVRVPTIRAHSLSVNIEFENPVSPKEAEKVLQEFVGVRVIDKEPFATPQDVSYKEEVYVSRIRQDLSHSNCLDLWICGDQLLKGASLNAIQIAEELQKSSAFLK